MKIQLLLFGLLQVVSPTYTKTHPDTNGGDKMQPAKEVTYKTKTKEAYDKKTATADNTPRDKIKTKETLTNLEILFDDNERLQIKLLEEKDKVALLEEERTNLRRKIDEKEKIIHITEKAKDAFRSRLDATEDTLAKKEEDFRLFKVKFEAMRKNEEQLAWANQMLEDELIQQIQQERINTGNFKQLCLQKSASNQPPNFWNMFINVATIMTH